MKIKYIIAIVLIGFSLAVILSTYGDSSTYVDFAQAAEHPGKEFHVVGQVNKAKEMHYKPLTDGANYFTFYLKDDKGVERMVIYNDPKPADFDKSEKIVLIGKMEGDAFHASNILLKCPSKYNDGKMDVAQQKI
jgi:cytochrome c-type biogenesis protein CcmE